MGTLELDRGQQRSARRTPQQDNPSFNGQGPGINAANTKAPKHRTMKQYDVVYILKNDIRPDELRYSLRSVVKNLNYKNIWFYGGCPAELKPDRYVRLTQHGDTKWAKVAETLKVACRNDDLTENIWLFNDDFFLLNKLTTEQPFVQGSLAYRCQRIKEVTNGRPSPYAEQLNKTLAVLKHNGRDRLDYALHVPILINRRKAYEVLTKFPDVPMFRSLYGNYWRIGGTIIDDVKIQNNDDIPGKGWRFVSTSDGSFIHGRVGDYIREQFKEPTKYEI